MRSRSESCTILINCLKFLPQNPLVFRKANRAHKLISQRLPLLAIPTRNAFIRKSNQNYTWHITSARKFVIWPNRPIVFAH